MNKTLVIMAAGMGSRFGGLKQIEPVGPSGEIIADYSVYDAYLAGFKNVVFIIRKEHEGYFKENIINKYSDLIDVKLAYQELDIIPNDVKLPSNRVKMLGTGHALYCAMDKIEGNFIVINADDFYGREAFMIAANFFDTVSDDNTYLSINYPFISTSSEFGKVKRGIVKEEDGYLVDTIESEIELVDGSYIATSLTDNKQFKIDKNQLVSMNFFGLRPSFFPILSKSFDKFIHKEIGLNDEFLLPLVLKSGIKNGSFKVKSVDTKSKWLGMTYKEELDSVKRSINELVKRGEYPNKLW